MRTISDVRDAVNAYFMLVTVKQFGECYNIGGNQSLTIEILEFLISISSIKKFKIIKDPERFRPIDAGYKSDCKSLSHTGWT